MQDDLDYHVDVTDSRLRVIYASTLKYFNKLITLVNPKL